MRRRVVIVAGVAVLLVVAAASLVRVPAGQGAWCGGRYLGPGLQLKTPFARVVRYPADEQSLEVSRSLPTDAGDTVPVTAALRFRWDAGRLPSEPLDPATLDDVLGAAMERAGGIGTGAAVGEEAERLLDARLDELPVTVLELEVEYPNPAVEALRAAARPRAEPVVVVGLDGFDWVLLDRLIAEGRCPTLARMKRQGAWGEIISRPPVLSPLIWTTMASGRLPEDHGILDFVVRDAQTGRDMPITNQSRRVQAFWNILSDVGRSVNVVNWWATYPAEPINGVMVSERVFYQLFGIRPSLDDPANTSPPEVMDEIRPLLVEADDIDYDEVREYVTLGRAEYDAEIEEASLADNPFDNRVNHLRKIIAVSRGVFNVGRWLLDKHPADITALYVEGTDTIGHRFAHFLPPKLPWVSQHDFDRYNQAMARYYELVDRLLGELMEHGPEDATWIVVSDHGFFTGAARPSVEPDDFTTGAPQWHRMVGAFLASGPNVRTGKIPRVHIDDLCRTLLWLAGAPASAELRGTALVAMMRPEWVEAHPPAEVPSYAGLPRTWIRETSSSALDDARMAELAALGYIAETRPTPEPAAGGGPGGESKMTEPYNLAKIAHSRGDLAEAERLYKQALEMEPGFVLAMVSLAAVYEDMGRPVERLRWILRALQTGNPNVPPAALLDFVDAAEAAGRLDRVLPALDMIREQWGRTSTFHAARGEALERLGRLDEAAAAYRAAIERDPADPVATEALLKLAAAGRPVDVDALLAGHLEAVRGDLKRLNELAVICLRHHRPALAERALETVLASDPTNFGVLSNLAVALQLQGKSDQAADILERAVVERPDDPSLQFNLGATLASLERNEEALGHLERARRLGGSDPRIYTAISKVLVRMGRSDEAAQVLEEGRRLHPDNAEIGQLLGLLQADG